MTDKIPPHVTMAPVVSSQISKIGHDPQNNHLYIQFAPGKRNPDKPGSVYRYAGVDADKHKHLTGFDPKTGEAITGHSIGSHFGRHIKGNSDAHPHTRLDIEE